VTIVGVGEEDPGPRPGHAVPFPKDLAAVRQVAHHVDRDDADEGPLCEWKRASGIGPDEARSIREAAFLGESRRGCDALLEEVNTDDAGPGPLGQAQSRPARAAAHVEQP
jgi:hypothetical protein